jgi:hypothetical protein
MSRSNAAAATAARRTTTRGSLFAYALLLGTAALYSAGAWATEFPTNDFPTSRIPAVSVPQPVLPTYLPIPDSSGGGKDQRLRPGLDAPGIAIAPSVSGAALGLTPGCTMGRDAFTVATDGRVLFGGAIQPGAQPGVASGPCAALSNTDGVQDTNF